MIGGSGTVCTGGSSPVNPFLSPSRFCYPSLSLSEERGQGGEFPEGERGTGEWTGVEIIAPAP